MLKISKHAVLLVVTSQHLGRGTTMTPFFQAEDHRNGPGLLVITDLSNGPRGDTPPLLGCPRKLVNG